jgi:type I restriction enzyme S subunit
MIGDLKPYSVYKDSGLEWLGPIPEHWTVTRAKNLFRCIDVRSATGDEELLTVSSALGVIPRRMTTVTMFKAESYIGHKLCWPNDLIINSLWAWARGLGVSAYHGIISTAYGVYRLRDDSGVDPRFVHELVRSPAFQWELQVRSKGVWTSRLQLTDDSFLRAPFPVPSLKEQAAIVKYLDHIDRRILRYIRAKQTLIKLLEEQKRALTSSAVLHGVDANSETVPSRNAWSDNAPAHWSRLRLKDVAWIQTGLTLGKNYSGKELRTYPYLRVANVQTGRLDLRVVKVVEVPPEEAERCCLEEGDVLMTEGGDIDKLGRGCIWRSEIDNCLHQNHIFAVRCRPELDPNYLVALMGSTHGRAYFETTAKQTTNLASTNSTTLRAFPIALPPIDEQLRILGHLEHALAPTDAAFEQARREIDLLREYHLRLITDVVTGKLDVSEAAASLPEDIIEEGMAQDELEPFAEDGLEDDDPSLEAELEEVDA